MTNQFEPDYLAATVSICGSLVTMVGVYKMYKNPGKPANTNTITDNSRTGKIQEKSELGLTLALSGIVLTGLAVAILLIND